MKKHQFTLVIAFTIGFLANCYAQHGHYNIKNGFAIGGGITQFNIITDNFEIEQGRGWLVHATATVDLTPKSFNVSYGMQLSENSIVLNGLESTTGTNFKPIEYKIFTAQLAYLWHFKFNKNPHFTLDIGPMLQYNSDLELSDKEQEDYIISAFGTASAKEVKDINNVNFNGAVGVTAGYSFFKIRLQYMYGFTNILGRLNDAEFNKTLKKQFKGNQSMLALTGMITF